VGRLGGCVADVVGRCVGVGRWDGGRDVVGSLDGGTMAGCGGRGGCGGIVGRWNGDGMSGGCGGMMGRLDVVGSWDGETVAGCLADVVG
jgi:hypothetical protein